MVRVLDHPARLHDRHGHPVPRSIRDLQQWGVICFQQGLTGDHEHQNVFQCERTLRMRETGAHAVVCDL